MWTVDRGLWTLGNGCSHRLGHGKDAQLELLELRAPKYVRAPSPPLLLLRLFLLSNTRTASFTYNFVTHHLSHTPLSHTTLSHIIFHTPSYHHLSQTIFYTHLCHTPSLTHLRDTPSFTHNLSHTSVSRAISHTDLCHTPLSHTDLCQPLSLTGPLRGRRGAWRPVPSFQVAGVALGDIHLRFAWQAWPLWHWAGSGGAHGLDWSPLTPQHFAWQAWRLGTSAFVSHGRHGSW